LDVAHVGIDPLTLKAASGQFHSTRVLAPRQYLTGRIWADEAGGDALRQFFDGGRTLRVGRGRSRGQGRLKAWISERVEPPGEELASRILEFNRRAWEKFPALADNLMFSCTLRSAAYALDEWLLSRSYLIPADFGSDEVFQSYHLATWACGTTRISGWHAAAQLPKGEITAIAAGSCFLFSRNRPGGSDEAECARLASVLGPLECRGVGERRPEGFGEAVFCDRFHSDRAAGEKE
jgi:CRISPR-associated protein Csx10